MTVEDLRKKYINLGKKPFDGSGNPTVGYWQWLENRLSTIYNAEELFRDEKVVAGSRQSDKILRDVIVKALDKHFPFDPTYPAHKMREQNRQGLLNDLMLDILKLYFPLEPAHQKPPLSYPEVNARIDEIVDGHDPVRNSISTAKKLRELCEQVSANAWQACVDMQKATGQITKTEPDPKADAVNEAEIFVYEQRPFEMVAYPHYVRNVNAMYPLVKEQQGRYTPGTKFNASMIEIVPPRYNEVSPRITFARVMDIREAVSKKQHEDLKKVNTWTGSDRNDPSRKTTELNYDLGKELIADEKTFSYHSLTEEMKLDYSRFAGQAMQGLLSGRNPEKNMDHSWFVRNAYDIAQAMITEDRRRTAI